MKNHLTNKRRLASLAFLLALSPVTYANQTNLNPVDGVSLHDIIGEISRYRTCMDTAQLTLQETAKKGKNTYKQAQLHQCHDAFTSLGQLMDKQSLKSIDHLSWQRWRKQRLGAGFTTERLLKKPTALLSGMESEMKNGVRK